MADGDGDGRGDIEGRSERVGTVVGSAVAVGAGDPSPAGHVDIPFGQQ